MKKWLKKLSIISLAILLVTVLLGGCSKKEEKSSEEEFVDAIGCLPVTINGKDILVGETTVQTLLDEGFKVTVSEMDANNEITEYEIDPSTMLEANSYYSGASMWLTENTFAHISFVTDEKEIPLGEATVARLEINISYSEIGLLDTISFNGVPFSELSREKAGEQYPNFTGDENMWFSSVSTGESNYSYFMSFSSENKLLSKLEAERKYDVDWTGDGQ